MLLFLSIIGIFLSVILFSNHFKKNSSIKYLSTFFLLLSLYSFYQYVLLYSKSDLLIEILLFGYVVVFPPIYLIGPMLYWYIRSVLTDDSRLKRSDLWHLVPMIIFFLAALPYLFVPFSDKIEVARAAAKDVSMIAEYKATVLDEIFSVSANFLSRPILVLIYLFWSMGLLIRFSWQGKASKVFARQYFMTKWLYLLLAFLFVLLISQILLISKAFAMDFSNLFFALNVFRIISLIGLFGLLISPFFFPEILYGLPRIPQLESSVKFEDKQITPDQEKKSNNLESDYLRLIEQKVEAYMVEYEPYLLPDFNLIRLSALAGIPAHHLSYFFREVKKRSFNDYRNQWRIKHAKDLIKSGKAKEMTLEAIGLLSGFTTRNTFLTTFKKVEGITPNAFASQLKN